MARTTPNYQIPYPELTDRPDGATQMKDLATQVDTKVKVIDNRLVATEGVVVPWTPTFTGLTLGNGAITADVYKLGKLITVAVRIKAAAASPTTVWVAGNAATTLPFNAKNQFYGQTYWTGKLGGCYVAPASNSLVIGGVRQTDLVMVSPSTAWGTSAWAANADANINITFIAE